MKYCGNCGAANEDDAVICGECGKKIDEIAEEAVAPAKNKTKASGVSAVLCKFRYLILNCIVLAVSVLVMINGFVGNFTFRLYYSAYTEYGGYEVDYIDVEQNLYRASEAFLANLTGYEEESRDEYFVLREKVYAICKGVGWGYYPPTAEQKKALAKELSKVDMVKYMSMSGGYGDVSGFTFQGLKIFGFMAMAALPVSMASALASLIFAILCAVNIARKKDGKCNTALSVPFILTCVSVCILSLGGFLASALTVASVVLLLVGAAAVAAITVLTAETVEWRSVILYGVAFAVSLAVLLPNVFFGGKASENMVMALAFRGYAHIEDPEILLYTYCNPFIPVVCGLACAIFAGGLAGLMGHDRLKKIKQLTIANIVLAALGMMWPVFFSLLEGYLNVGVDMVATVLLSVGLLIFLCLFKVKKKVTPVQGTESNE